MLSREFVLLRYGVPDFQGAAADGGKIRICCTTGRMVYLARSLARKLAAELTLIGATEELDELLQALSGDE